MISNITADFLINHKKSPGINELSIKQMDSVFFDVLNEYALDSSWISKRKIRQPENDSVQQEYSVILPKDLPVPYIIQDLDNKFDKDITALVAHEKKSFGTTVIKIYSNESLKLQAVFEPNPDLIRDRNNLYFILKDAYLLSMPELKKLLASPFPLTFCLLPSDNSSAVKDTIQNYSKDYAVWINDNISDNKFRMEAVYQKELLRSSIKNIIESYKNASLFIIDSRSKLYNSTVYNFVRDYFKSWGIKLYNDTDFILLHGDTNAELFSLMKYYANVKDSSRDKVCIVDKDDFDLLKDELELLKKKGNKFLPVKAFLPK